jgi:hypothetical protein
MSALGQKRTFLDVRFSLNDVRFTPESGHGWQPPLQFDPWVLSMDLNKHYPERTGFFAQTERYCVQF